MPTMTHADTLMPNDTSNTLLRTFMSVWVDIDFPVLPFFFWQPEQEKTDIQWNFRYPPAIKPNDHWDYILVFVMSESVARRIEFSLVFRCVQYTYMVSFLAVAPLEASAYYWLVAFDLFYRTFALWIFTHTHQRISAGTWKGQQGIKTMAILRKITWATIGG